jgi:hypothetical protein
MRIIKELMMCLALCLVDASACYGQGWRGIVPLRSTRQDVERAIGRPTESNGITYNLKDERVSIFYSSSPCVTGWPYGWNVAPDVVTKIVVYPQVKVTVAELGINTIDYTRTQNSRLGGVDYTNKEIGISIGVNNNGDVDVVQYEPSLKDKGLLLCPDAALRQQEIESGQSAYIVPITHYSNLSRKEEATRMGFFAEQVKKYPVNSKIYIIGYADPKECEDEATNRINRVKNRLASHLRIDPDRIDTINGGRKNAVWTELYVVRPGGPRPLATPEISPASVTRVNCTPPRPRRR